MATANHTCRPLGYTVESLQTLFGLSEGKARYLMSRVPEDQISRTGPDGSTGTRVASEEAIRKLLPNVLPVSSKEEVVS